MDCLARLLVMLFGMVFTVPAQTLSWNSLRFTAFAVFVVANMIGNKAITSRRLSTLKMAEIFLRRLRAAYVRLRNL